MSHQAIAAALARDELTGGERLVAFSLASFADRENRARPGTPAGAERAGLARSRYLEARDRLAARGLVVVEDAAGGRGRASIVALRFAESGPWWEGEINAALFEAVLGYSRTRGPARLLLAVIAALADEQGLVEGVTTERLCAAARVADRTYRRARATLLASRELVLRSGSGGRGNTNCWEVPDPRTRRGATPPPRRRRVPAPAGARPLMATPAVPPAADEQDLEAVPAQLVSGARRHAVGAVKGGQNRKVSTRKGPVLTGVSQVKGGQDRTLSRETPAQTPAKTPAPNARAGREPQNPRTIHPPSPPQGGSAGGQVLVEETYLTERGRPRRRLVAVDPSALRERLKAVGEADLAAWKQVRAFLREALGESTFEIWLASLEPIAVDVEGTLVVSAPAETLGWVARRFGRILDAAAHRAGRRLRISDEVERKAAESLTSGAAANANAAPAGASDGARFSGQVGSPPCAADTPLATSIGSLPDGPRGRRDDPSPHEPTNTSAYPSFYTDVYTQAMEVCDDQCGQRVARRDG